MDTKQFYLFSFYISERAARPQNLWFVKSLQCDYKHFINPPADPPELYF